MCDQKGLFEAIKKGSTWSVIQAINHGASVVNPKKSGTTPLLCAVKKGDVRIMHVLLKRGAQSTVNLVCAKWLVCLKNGLKNIDNSLARAR